jgi:hypothetical protein
MSKAGTVEVMIGPWLLVEVRKEAAIERQEMRDFAAAIVTPGCEACSKRINTNSQYLRHLSEDVLPGILENALHP